MKDFIISLVILITVSTSLLYVAGPVSVQNKMYSAVQFFKLPPSLKKEEPKDLRAVLREAYFIKKAADENLWAQLLPSCGTCSYAKTALKMISERKNPSELEDAYWIIKGNPVLLREHRLKRTNKKSRQYDMLTAEGNPLIAIHSFISAYFHPEKRTRADRKRLKELKAIINKKQNESNASLLKRILAERSKYVP